MSASTRAYGRARTSAPPPPAVPASSQTAHLVAQILIALSRAEPADEPSWEDAEWR